MTTVDRTYPLADFRFGHANPDRVRVTRIRSTGWWVWRGAKPLRIFPTHAEAIRWAQGRAVLDRYPDAPRYRLDSSRKPAQDARTDAVSGPNHTHVISGPQNGSNDLDPFPAPMEAP